MAVQTDSDVWEKPSGNTLVSDLESIDVVVLSEGKQPPNQSLSNKENESFSLFRASGGLRLHRIHTSMGRLPGHPTRFGTLHWKGDPVGEADDNALAARLSAGKFFLIEVALTHEGPPDPYRSGTSERNVSDECIEAIRTLYTQVLERDVDALVDVATRPFDPISSRNLVFSSEKSGPSNTRTIDLRVGTITTFGGTTSYGVRNLRIVTGPDFMLMLYGPIEDNHWNIPAHKNYHYRHLIVPSFDLDRIVDRITTSDDELTEVVQIAFDQLLRSLVHHLDWALARIIHEPGAGDRACPAPPEFQRVEPYSGCQIGSTQSASG